MARCWRKQNLEVHHIRRDGGDGLSNAQVLCHRCHEETSTYGVPDGAEEPFDEVNKQRALDRADNQCECTCTRGCH